jgi:hypothetical protein
MELGLTAAVMTHRRSGDASRYDGWVGLSALPGAPVIAERARRRPWRLHLRRLARLTARQAVPRTNATSGSAVGSGSQMCVAPGT